MPAVLGKKRSVPAQLYTVKLYDSETSWRVAANSSFNPFTLNLDKAAGYANGIYHNEVEKCLKQQIKDTALG